MKLKRHNYSSFITFTYMPQTRIGSGIWWRACQNPSIKCTTFIFITKSELFDLINIIFEQNIWNCKKTTSLGHHRRRTFFRSTRRFYFLCSIIISNYKSQVSLRGNTLSGYQLNGIISDLSTYFQISESNGLQVLTYDAFWIFSFQEEVCVNFLETTAPQTLAQV